MRPSRVEGEQHHHQERGRQAGDEHLLDGERLALAKLLRHHAVENQRHGRHHQQAQAAGRGHQPQAEALAVAAADEHGHQQPSQRHDGHAGSAGERGEQGARHEAHHRQPAGIHPNSAWVSAMSRSDVFAAAIT